MVVKVIEPFFNKFNLEERFETGVLLKIYDENRRIDLINRGLVIEIESQDIEGYIELDSQESTETVENVEEVTETVEEKKNLKIKIQKKKTKK